MLIKIRALLGNLTVAQLVKQFSALYATKEIKVLNDSKFPKMISENK